MKKQYRIIYIVVFIAALSACKKIDNYDTPNGGVYGKLIDEITNESFQTEQPNGFKIKLFEKGGKMNAPIIFSAKPDGTFENAWIFQNEYKVIPTEGAFFSTLDTVVVQVGNATEVNFTVTPFLAITDVTIQASAGKINSSYTIARNQIGDKIVELKTLVSKVPTVDNLIYNFKKENDVTNIVDADIVGSRFSDEVSELTAGDYYVRIAARTNNTLRKYNYSKIVKVTVQ